MAEATRLNARSRVRAPLTEVAGQVHFSGFDPVLAHKPLRIQVVQRLAELDQFGFSAVEFEA